MCVGFVEGGGGYSSVRRVRGGGGYSSFQSSCTKLSKLEAYKSRACTSTVEGGPCQACVQ